MRVGHFIGFDVFDKQCENRAAANEENGAVDRKHAPLAAGVKDKAEQHRCDRLRRHAGGVVVTGEFANLFA